MPQDLEKLIVSLEANLKQYERELARAQRTTVSQLRKIEGDAAKSMGRVEKSFAKAGSFIAGFGKGLVIGGITAAVAGIGALVKGSISSAAAVGDLSDKLGITSDKLQELQFGAVQANMGFDELESSMLKFSKSLGQARNGQGDLLKTLEANGFDKAKIKAMSYSEALDTVADLVKNAATEQDALLIITQAFGKGGDEMLEFLRNGSAGLKKFGKEAHDSDAVIREGLIRSAQELDDRWAALMQSMSSKTRTAVLGITDLLGELFTLTNVPAGMRMGRGKAGVSATLDALSPLKRTFKPVGNFGGSGSPTPSTATKLFDPEVAAAQKTATDAATKAYTDQQKAITGVISALQFENEQLNRSELSQAIANEQRKAGVSATSEQGKAIAELVTNNFELARSLEITTKAGEDFLEAQQQMNDSFMALAEIGVDALDAIALGGEKASDVIKELAQNLLRAAVQASLFGTGPFASLFGTSSSGGIFGSLFGKAAGGHVNAGQPYIVGEKRPELFVPSQSGSIVPRIGGGTGGAKVTVNNFAGVDVKTSQDSAGNPIIAIRRMVADTIGSGFANSAMRNQFGVKPQKARR